MHTSSSLRTPLHWRSAASLALLTALVAGATGCAQVTIVTGGEPDGGSGDSGQGDGGAADGGGGGGDQCITDFDCVGAVKGTTPCRLPSCDKGTCKLKDRDVGVVCQVPGEVLGACEESKCAAGGACEKSAKADGFNCGVGACGQVCDAGACRIATAADYDDDNPCTTDFCDQGKAIVHAPITDLTIQCDDGSACSSAGACIDGACASKPIDCSDGIACTIDTCDKTSGCKHVGDDKGCDDGDVCTTQTCNLEQGCVVSAFAAGAKCNDGNDCTTDDACDKDGNCTGPSSCACKLDADCKTENLCLGALKCNVGKCETVAANAVSCPASSNTACAVGICQPTTGKCEPVPTGEGLACDDADACTTVSTCKGGACLGSTPPSCDDGIVCTADSCDSKTGCVNAFTSASCDDKNPCTDNDTCVNGGCSGVAKACDDGKACTFDSCDKASGSCKNEPQNSLCDDKNPCTKDVCASTGCTTTPDDAGKCDDGDACTVDACKGGTCTSTNTCPCKPETAAKDCNDNNPCTVDTCDLAAQACQNNTAGADGKACDSGDKCQQPGSGVCNAGVCKPGNKPIDCSSKSGPCTNGTCAASTGACVASPKADGIGCNADNDVCTTNDACKAGTCVAGGAAVCDDKSPCTIDACDKAKGCVFTPMADGSKCDDGDLCTGPDQCGSGSCKPGPVKSCDDGSNCTSDNCKSGTCFHTPIPNCCTKVLYAQSFDFKLPPGWKLDGSHAEAMWRFRSDIKPSYSPPGVLHYGTMAGTSIGPNNSKTDGSAMLPPLDTAPWKVVTLQFRLYWDVETIEQYDKLFVELVDASGAGKIIWTLPKFQFPAKTWHQISVEVPGGNTQTYLRFRFDTIDTAANDNLTGIFIDDVQVAGPCL